MFYPDPNLAQFATREPQALLLDRARQLEPRITLTTQICVATNMLKIHAFFKLLAVTLLRRQLFEVGVVRVEVRVVKNDLR